MDETSPAARTVIWNVPNILTVSRLVLSVVCFFCLVFEWYLPALIFFAIAAGTDWVDGYWARKYGQVTKLGRILDPFADKIIICGTFIFLAAVPVVAKDNSSASQVTAWMAVIVVARELLVTALRSFFEESGQDFSAKMSGKLKMVFQCIAVAASLARLWHYDFKAGFWHPSVGPPAWTGWAVWLAVWVAIGMTIYSGWVYVQRALVMLRK